MLKHKIVDAVRRHARFDSLEDGCRRATAPSRLECPQPGPDEVAEQRQLLARVLDRIDALPSTLRDVVRLRLLDDQPTATVCRTLGISEENLFVRMHRARKQFACRRARCSAPCADG